MLHTTRLDPVSKYPPAHFPIQLRRKAQLVTDSCLPAHAELPPLPCSKYTIVYATSSPNLIPVQAGTAAAITELPNAPYHTSERMCSTAIKKHAALTVRAGAIVRT